MKEKYICILAKTVILNVIYYRSNKVYRRWHVQGPSFNAIGSTGQTNSVNDKIRKMILLTLGVETTPKVMN